MYLRRAWRRLIENNIEVPGWVILMEMELLLEECKQILETLEDLKI